MFKSSGVGAMVRATRDTHKLCRAFGSGAVTTCFNDLGLSRLGFEHPTIRLRGERSNPAARAEVTLFTCLEIYATKIKHLA